MAKILLIPAPLIIGNRIEPYMPYGLCSLQAISEKYETVVDILQPDKSALKRELCSSSELADVLLDQVDLNDYDTLGLSTVSTGFHHSLNIVQAIKHRMPEMKIWLGGVHASVVAEPLLNVFKEVDAIFIGESEMTFAEVLARRDNNNQTINGIAGIKIRNSEYAHREKIRNLDNLPLITSSKTYLDYLLDQPGKRLAPLEVVRGCPGRCSFCSTRHFWGSTARRKSDKRILYEMKRIFELTGSKDFGFIGDNFSTPRSNLLNFCRKIIESKLSFNWSCSLRSNDIELDDLHILWSAGCRGFFTGVESGSLKTQNIIKKTVKLDHVIELITKATDIGFEVKTSFIIGFPWETSKDIDCTYKLHCKMLDLGVARSDIHILVPLPGTDILSGHDIKFEIDSHARCEWIDQIPLENNIQDLIRLYPEMFVQMGYFKTNYMSRFDVLKTRIPRNLTTDFQF